MLTINFALFPSLETERLVLRRLDSKDANDIFTMRSNPETMKYIPRPILKNQEDACKLIAILDAKIDANEGINWGITLKNDSKVIGIIGYYRAKPEHYRAEIGYMLLPEYSRKGITSEAVKRVIQYGFEDMKLHSIEAVLDAKNWASERLLKKNGFVKEGHFIENQFYNGHFRDTLIYTLLAKNYNCI